MEADIADTDSVWSERDTTPAAVDAALRELLKQRHAEDEAFVPARVLNLIVIADRDWRGEIQNRLDRVGRYHASRTILCDVEKGRDTIDAWATTSAAEADVDGVHVSREQVVLDVGERHLKALDTIVDPLVVPDLATLVWAPHGHTEAVDSLSELAQIVLVDSVNEPDPKAAVERAEKLCEWAYVVDLAWLRSTPWRERTAATFDPADWRAELGKISAVTVRHKPDSPVAGLLFFGWLATRLGWEPGQLVAQGDALHGTAHARRQDVKLRLEPDPTMSMPGLAGLTVETASGMSISLNRGPGGLSAERRTRKGGTSEWTVMGASRGESGILGEGIRQALLRDPTYRPSLDAAKAMV